LNTAYVITIFVLPVLDFAHMLTYLLFKDAVKNDFRYIVVGSLDNPDSLPPKGEFFCKYRASWMPEITSKYP
jgi:hypothetical protein